MKSGCCLLMITLKVGKYVLFERKKFENREIRAKYRYNLFVFGVKGVWGTKVRLGA